MAPPSPLSPTTSAPLGGLGYALPILLLLAAINVVTGASGVATVTLLPVFGGAFAIEPRFLAPLLISLPLACQIVALIPLAVASDAGRRGWWLAGALLLVALGGLVMAATPTAALLILGRCLMAAGEGAALPIAMAAAGDAFRATWRPGAVGVIVLAGLVGQTLGAPFASVLANAGAFRLTYSIIGCGALLLAVLAALTVRGPATRGRLGGDLGRLLSRGGPLLAALGGALAAVPLTVLVVFLPRLMMPVGASMAEAGWMMAALHGGELIGVLIAAVAAAVLVKLTGRAASPLLIAVGALVLALPLLLAGGGGALLPVGLVLMMAPIPVMATLLSMAGSQARASAIMLVAVLRLILTGGVPLLLGIAFADGAGGPPIALMVVPTLLAALALAGAWTLLRRAPEPDVVDRAAVFA